MNSLERETHPNPAHGAYRQTDRPTDRPDGPSEPSPAQPSPGGMRVGLVGASIGHRAIVGLQQPRHCRRWRFLKGQSPQKNRSSGRRPNSNRSTRLAGWSTRDWPEANWPAGRLDWLAGRSQPSPWGLAGGVGVQRTFPGLQQPKHCRSWGF